MKKNLMTGLMLAFLPLNMVSIPKPKQNIPEILMCKTIPVSSKNPVSEKKVLASLSLEVETPKTTVAPIPTIALSPKTTTQVQGIVAPEDLEGLFEQYAQEYGVDSSTLKIIAKCESRFNPNAQSKNGLYGGLFQYSVATWISTRNAMGLDENPELRFNAQEAIMTSAFKIANGGISAWHNCAKKVQN